MSALIDRLRSHRTLGYHTECAIKGLVLLGLMFLLPVRLCPAGELQLEALIDEALQNSPEIKAVAAGVSAAKHRIPQVQSLADPMVMVGYQNEGFNRITYGDSTDAQLMFSASQMFPFPGKRRLKGEMATQEAESAQANYHIARLKMVAKVTGYYYDLLLAYKTIALLDDRVALFARIENAATARYSSGMGSQQELLMAQTEKYMVLERKEMQRQKIQATEAMLGATLGRGTTTTFERPAEPVPHTFTYSLPETIAIAGANSHDILAKEKMVEAAGARVAMAKKEYYPDVTVTANYANRSGGAEDMWSLTTQINIPLYAGTKQDEGVREAEALLAAAKNELEATKLMVSSTIQESYSMAKSAEQLMGLYKNGLIPKTSQDIEAALSGYVTGKVEAMTVILRLKALIDFEILYWEQFASREKAVVKLLTMAEIYGMEK